VNSQPGMLVAGCLGETFRIGGSLVEAVVVAVSKGVLPKSFLECGGREGREAIEKIPVLAPSLFFLKLEPIWALSLPDQLTSRQRLILADAGEWRSPTFRAVPENPI